jgi:hypothetical protein
MMTKSETSCISNDFSPDEEEIQAARGEDQS